MTHAPSPAPSRIWPARKHAGRRLVHQTSAERPPVVHIPLHGATGVTETFALVDADDWHLVCNDRWSLSPDGYAVNDKGGYLHLLLMCPDLDREETVFLDRNKINCRRVNMRNVDVKHVKLVFATEVRGKLEALAATHGITVEMVIERLVAGVPAHGR